MLTNIYECTKSSDAIMNHVKPKGNSTTSFLTGLFPDHKRRNDYESLDGVCSVYYPEINTGYKPISSELSDITNILRESKEAEISNISALPKQNQNKNGKLFGIHFNFALYVIIFVGYLVLGAVCFVKIELPVEQEMRISFKKEKEAFLNRHPEITDDDLEDFLTQIIRANDRGISPLRNVSTELNWGFGQALFFSSTVVTTIGYGHVTPLSQTGKIFCMIYASIGIPLTLVLLTAIIERLLIPTNWLLGSLNAKLGHLYQPFNIRILHLFIIVVIVGILAFAIPTAIFTYLEPSWGALDAFYYCFISLSTIGLGDYIPGDGVSVENRSLYKICITCYLICGLVAIMLALTVFYEIPQLNLGQLFTETSPGETEKLRLSGGSAPCYSGPSGLYIPQRDEDIRRAVVRIRPHGDESPSPDEHPSSLHKDVRVP